MRSRMLIGTGLLLLWFVWWGGLPGLAPGPFSAHMIMHMGVVAVAAPMLALGVAGTRLDPVLLAPRWFSPVPVSVVELVIVWVWHAPVPHHWARNDSGGMVCEQGMFLIAGVWMWLAACGGGQRNRLGGGVIGLLLTSMHMTLLGALLALSPRPLYAHATHETGLSALADQHLGGAIMLFIGGVSYLAGGLGLTARLLSDKRARMKTEPAVIS